MTNEATNQPSEAPKPWEQNWVLKAKQAVESAVESVKKPWEAMWKEKPRSTPPEPVREAPSPVKPIETEKDMKAATSDLFTPQANARRTAQEKSTSNIAELQAEIENTKDPKKKKILQEYLTSLGKK